MHLFAAIHTDTHVITRFIVIIDYFILLSLNYDFFNSRIILCSLIITIHVISILLNNYGTVSANNSISFLYLCIP